MSQHAAAHQKGYNDLKNNHDNEASVLDINGQKKAGRAQNGFSDKIQGNAHIGVKHDAPLENL